MKDLIIILLLAVVVFLVVMKSVSGATVMKEGVCPPKTQMIDNLCYDSCPPGSKTEGTRCKNGVGFGPFWYTPRPTKTLMVKAVPLPTMKVGTVTKVAVPTPPNLPDTVKLICDANSRGPVNGMCYSCDTYGVMSDDSNTCSYATGDIDTNGAPIYKTEPSNVRSAFCDTSANDMYRVDGTICRKK
jgi:hypothetical protein